MIGYCAIVSLLPAGKGLQKVGVQNLPELCLRRKVIVEYLSCATWRNGLILDITGALFGLAALTIVPISIAQPIFCNGLPRLGMEGGGADAPESLIAKTLAFSAYEPLALAGTGQMCILKSKICTRINAVADRLIILTYVWTPLIS